MHREVELMQAVHHQQPVVVVDEAHLLDKEMLDVILINLMQEQGLEK